MGRWYTPKRRAKGQVKVIDPQPIWEITIEEKGKVPYKIFARTEKAEEYFRAGFPVKLVTTAGALQQEKIK